MEEILAKSVHTGLDDVVAWAWHNDSKGMFSVRSAYRVHRDHEKRSSRRGVASSVGADTQDQCSVEGVEDRMPRKNSAFFVEICS